MDINSHPCSTAWSLQKLESWKAGERIEDALVQLSQSILETVDSGESKHNEDFEDFVVVQYGLYIEFFES